MMTDFTHVSTPHPSAYIRCSIKTHNYDGVYVGRGIYFVKSSGFTRCRYRITKMLLKLTFDC